MNQLRRVLPYLLVFAACGALRAETREVVAVASRASDDYIRTPLANGALPPETYAFGKGGLWAGSAAGDTVDKLDFRAIAFTIAGALAAQNYVPAKDPAKTRLLIMVYWGVTRAPEPAGNLPGYQLMQAANEKMSIARAHNNQEEIRTADAMMSSAMGAASAENQRRNQADFQNAQILGYESWWKSTTDLVGTVYGRLRRQDMLDELEEDRYFVVLMAYDFQLMLKQKKKLLWETRISIRGRGNDFGDRLAAMTRDASRYFGRSSDGLVHRTLPEGRVELGPVKTLEFAPSK